MLKIKYGGTITMFYSIVFMVLLTFCATIVDATRIHLGVIQSERALQVASQSILASYDSQLFEQYGIFGKSATSKEMIRNNINYYVEGSLDPESTLTDASLISQTFFNDSDYFHIYDYDYSIDNISNEQTIVNPDYIRLQILEFMKYRGPVLSLSPFLAKIEAIEKTAKTTKILKKKTKIVSRLEGILCNIIALENRIDGIEINTGTGGYYLDSKGAPSLSKNYIKKVFTMDTYTLPVYKVYDIPDEGLRTALEDNLWYIDRDISIYMSLLRILDTNMGVIVRKYVRYDQKRQDILSITETRDALEPPDEDDEDYDEKLEAYEGWIDWYNKCIRELQVEVSDIEKDIDDLVEVYENYHLSMRKYLIKYRMIVNVEGKAENNQSIESLLDESIGYIHLIKQLSDSLYEEIKSLKEMCKNEENEYIEETCESIYKELQKYEKVLGLNEDGTCEVLNDLAKMEENLARNQSVILMAKKDIQYLWDNVNTINGYLKDKYLKDIDEEVAARFNSDHIMTINGSYSGQDDILEDSINHLSSLEKQLDSYTRDFYFDYSKMQAFEKKQFDFAMFIQQKKNQLKLDFGIIDAMTNVINDEELPSLIYGELKDDNTEVMPSDTYNKQEEMNRQINSLNSLYDTFQTVEEKVTGFRDEIYINEYILGMFNTAMDRHTFGTDSLLDDNLTLKGYDKNKHYMHFEAEYILFGYKTDKGNLLAAIAMMLMIRIALNVVHIVSNTEKMARINSLANAIAGWWTIGIGAVILSVIITAVWAMVESFIDIKALLKGKDVALIKTNKEWESDIFSSIPNELLEIIGEELTDEADEITDLALENNSLIPSLNYNDYIRFLLLSKIVKDDVKIYRIMDLIQLNITKERGEKIVLKNYISSFESSGEFKIDSLFLKGKWRNKVKVSY